MMTKTIKLTPALFEYFAEYGYRESLILQEIREFALTHPHPQMLSTIDTVQLLMILIKLTKAKHVLELGCFLGYSTAAMASALDEDGKVITLESVTEFATLAQGFWVEAQLDTKIECRLGLALETLDDFNEDSFDFIFIDADKPNYPLYYEKTLSLLKAGGLMVIDNTLFHGRVADESEHSQGTQAIRKLNALIKTNPRVDMLLLTVGDGMTLVLKH